MTTVKITHPDRAMKEGKRKDVLRALAQHGPMTQKQINDHVPLATRCDFRDLTQAGSIEVIQQVRIRLMTKVYAITERGLVMMNKKAKPPEDRRPRKTERRWPAEAPRVKNATTPALKPKREAPPPSITMPDTAKITVHQPKFTYETYKQPKNFMECVR